MEDSNLERLNPDGFVEPQRRSFVDLTLAVVCFFFGVLELTIVVGLVGGLLSAAYHGWFGLRHLLKPAGLVIHSAPFIFLAAAVHSFIGGQSALKGRRAIGVASLVVCALAVGLLIAAFKFG